MKRTYIASALLLSVAAGSCAFAAKNGNFYGGLSYGESDVDADISNLTGTVSLDEDDDGFKIFAGYNYNQNVSVEVHYADLGDIFVLKGNSGDTFDFDGSTFAFTASGVTVKTEGESLGVSGVFK